MTPNYKLFERELKAHFPYVKEICRYKAYFNPRYPIRSWYVGFNVIFNLQIELYRRGKWSYPSLKYNNIYEKYIFNTKFDFVEKL